MPFNNLGADKSLGAYVMKMQRSFKFLTAALMLAAAPWIVTSAVAAPISSSLELQNADPSSIETAPYVYEWNGAYRRADRRANRWDRRAYRRGYGYHGYNAYGLATGTYVAASYGGYSNPRNIIDPNGGPRPVANSNDSGWQCWVTTDKDRGFGYYGTCAEALIRAAQRRGAY